MYEEEFVDRLYLLRIKAGVSARDMSLSLGRNAGYINHIENNQSLPSFTSFFHICEYLKITPFEFFNMGNSNPLVISEINGELSQQDDSYLYTLLDFIRKGGERKK